MARYPFTAAAIASPTPVLPAVGAQDEIPQGAARRYIRGSQIHVHFGRHVTGIFAFPGIAEDLLQGIDDAETNTVQAR